MEEYSTVWLERQVESKVHWLIRNLERIGPVAYRLVLPPELAKLHDVFHVLMLQRYCSNESHILPVQEIQQQEDLSYDEEPKAIMDREVKQLRNKQVPLVKVVWQHQGREEAT